ncbi:MULTISPECIES: hypothetical protein [Vibrio]|uniref:hypothetical protein n=1 Tax=Vibrio TaxID=662 RepID=UPI000D376017|nr:hypothetical protein [Vibrio splendidus]PTP44277.1 hypothetical protein CWN87_08655 [Vibrio splendidus]
MKFFKFLSTFSLVFFITNTNSFELDLKSKLQKDSREVGFDNTKTFKGKGKPVHENLIVKSVMAAELPGYTFKDKVKLIEDLVIGVRWNDDPLQMFRKHLFIAVLSFSHSCKRKTSLEIDVDWDLFYRTHCGDMQFLHAMASKENETAQYTYQNIISWMEFSYKTATGSMPSDLRFRSVHYRMEPDTSTTFKETMISNNEGRSMWRAEGMFSFDCTRTKVKRKLKCTHSKYTKETTRNIALGSLLHVLQDSYSESHTKRDDQARIMAYGAYNLQDRKMHAEKDKSAYAVLEGELVKLSAGIIDSVIKDRKKTYKFDKVVRHDLDSWSVVKSKYIEPALRPVDMSETSSSLGLVKN